MKTICSLTRLETWRLRNGYAPARGGTELVTATKPNLDRQILGHSEVSSSGLAPAAAIGYKRIRTISIYFSEGKSHDLTQR
jgi:hypothetical protein